MLDAILAAARAARSVAPVMLSDKLFVRSLRSSLRFAGRRHRERFPAFAPPPLIFRKDASVLVLEGVPHRQRRIRLAIKCSRDDCDRRPRNELADKDDAAPPFIATLAPNIKTQVHFLEIAMKRNRQTDDTRVEE